MHIPVLVQEVLTYLNPSPGKTYIDATFGAGGHTRAILEKEPTCRVIALDWDNNALETYGVPLQEEFGDRLELGWGNFAHLQRIAKKAKLHPVDGILADFGLSTVQIKQTAGISFLDDTPLDMRMSPAHHRVTAQQLINYATEQELRDILWGLGEESHAKQIARALIAERKLRPITTTRQLAELVEKVVPKYGMTHPATKTFQAVRIYINKELDNIASFLAAVPALLAPEGRIVCISFHSLEDRIVKQFFNEQEQLGRLQVLTRKAVKPSEEEVQANRSARSAKLRAAQLRSC